MFTKKSLKCMISSNDFKIHNKEPIIGVCINHNETGWYASCIHPNKLPYERLYLHKDGNWRTTTCNEKMEPTGYFQIKEYILLLLEDLPYKEFKNVEEQYEYERIFWQL